MIFEINEWYGRFGNNIIALINAIMSSKKYKAKLIIPKHSVLNTYDIDFSDGIDDGKLFKHNFFQKNEYSVIITREDIIECVKEYLIKMVPKKILNNDFPDDVLVIHIRSGDAFLKHNFSEYYIQPPFSYYDKLISETNYKKYLIVSESYHNPVIKMLETKYKDKVVINTIENTIFNINNSFIIDLSILVSAKNIVLSNSTLSTTILLLSNKKDNVYFFNSNYKFCNSEYSMLTPIDKVLRYFDRMTIHYYNDLAYYNGIINLDTMIEKITNYKL